MDTPCTTPGYESYARKTPRPIPFEDYVLLLEEGLQVLEHGVVIVDGEGRIVFFSRTYGEFLETEPEKMLGRFSPEAIENSRMHIVVKSGEKEVGHSQKIRGEEMVVQRIPIRKDGKVVGAIGQVMFRRVHDVLALAEQLDVLKRKLKHYEREIRELRRARYSFENIIGESPAIQKAKREARNASKTSAPVLLVGESGTGKELFAHAIHNASPRARGPFVRINCAAIPGELIESELFGYEPGAFTGAGKKGKPGKFEIADGGTVYLDEIASMPLPMQASLLRVLQEKEFERVGGTKVIRSDFRIIASTNVPLEKLVAEGKFRKDLYYRLNVVPIYIPPLRERREDIPLLAQALAAEISEEEGTGEKTFSPSTLEMLARHDWPGNVRELRNVVGRLLLSVQKDLIEPEDVVPHLPGKTGSSSLPLTAQGKTLREVVAEVEKKVIEERLKAEGGNVAKAARSLGIHRTALYRKMNILGIPVTR